MRKLILLALLAAPLQAQSTARLYPDSTVRNVWDKVVACAGPTRDTAKTFEQITFIERDTVLSKAGKVLKGEWRSDTIFITKGFTDQSWVVAHEMLHHALNGPPTPNHDDPHVIAMAAFLGCGLAEFQQPLPNALPLPAYVPTNR